VFSAYKQDNVSNSIVEKKTGLSARRTFVFVMKKPHRRSSYFSWATFHVFYVYLAYFLPEKNSKSWTCANLHIFSSLFHFYRLPVTVSCSHTSYRV